MGESCLLFIQNRPKRAGAQTSLCRITQCDAIKQLSPVVLTSSHGWLNETLNSKGTPNISITWPGPRSLFARLGGLKVATRKIIRQLAQNGHKPTAIIANDHQETLLAHTISETLGGTPVFAILRTPGMSENDFQKYQCDQCTALFPRGKELTEQVTTWTNLPAHCLEGSFADEERHALVELPPQFPDSILVAGSEQPRKGFADLIDAIAIIEQEHPDFPSLTCVMTGHEPENANSNLRSTFEYVGRINDFVHFARNFPLAIHPSRSESFGMAPLELLLAGIPTLVSRTGVIDQLNLPENWCFKPESPRDMADRIVKLWQSWPDTGLNIPKIQDQLLANYHISNTAGTIAQAVQET